VVIRYPVVFLIGLLLALCGVSVFALPQSPQPPVGAGWVKCADEGGMCTPPVLSDVSFGSGSAGLYPDQTVLGPGGFVSLGRIDAGQSVACGTPAGSADPAENMYKACYYNAAEAPNPAPVESLQADAPEVAQWASKVQFAFVAGLLLLTLQVIFR
jgi:hypothetical protein